MRNMSLSFLVNGITLLLLLWCNNSWGSDSVHPTGFSRNEPDRLALLAFKTQIREDPLGALSSWNESLHHCQWTGVTCSSLHRDRVTILNLQFQQLGGTLSPHIGNLSFLRAIALTRNNFLGPIPQEIGRLSRLQKLFLSSNSFEAYIPTSLTNCSNLRMLVLGQNKLSGGVPIELVYLTKLTRLLLSNNELGGNIPSWLGNLSSLAEFAFGDNGVTGNIPDDFCHIQNLSFFHVGSNNLTGIVPSCFYNLSRITVFSIANNKLEGTVPRNIGLTLPNLEELHIGANRLTGVIPSSFANASKLESISLSENQFTGQVPTDLGRLQGLRRLLLASNQLGSTFGDDLDFITSLTNCSNLEWLSVFNNSLIGQMPNSIANLSTKVTSIQLGLNEIHGRFPPHIENLFNLTELDLVGNRLTGEIPEVIGMFSQMRKLYLNENQFSGKIPDSFSNLTQLTILILSRNKFHGRIPPSLGNCTSLSLLVISDNSLSGTIPTQVIGLRSLAEGLNLSNNALRGSLPSEVGNLSSLVVLDISENKLSGYIPTTLGECLNLMNLYMDGNFFEGNIPQSLTALKGIQELDLSRNKLSGEIPEYFGKFRNLTYLNLSHNQLEGPVPNDGVFANASAVSVAGNRKLCGTTAGLNLLPCPVKTLNRNRKSWFHKFIIPVVSVSVCLVLFLGFLFMCYQRKRSKEKPSSLSLFSHQYPRLSYAELLKATNNFSSDNLIGAGSYGSVYKGVLAEVDTIAVKVFNLQQRGASKSFLSECNTLRNLRHRNLLKIITSCSSVDFQGNDFKALVFEFMPNGSLEDWLHSQRDENHEPRNANFFRRLNIAIDIASALDYLHHHCQPAIVHCDLKPSNVLLDDDMIAHVADFGLAKIFSVTSHNSSQSHDSSFAVRGSIGYVPPEYGMGGVVSMQGDVYSYGILLLEMFTGKRPTNDIFQDGQNLHTYAKIALPEQVMTIVDPGMFIEGSDEVVQAIANNSDGQVRMQKCLISAMKLGVGCSAESPFERMNMGEVITELYRIRDHYQGARICLD